MGRTMKRKKILKTALALLLGSSAFNGSTIYGASYTTTQEATGDQEVLLGDGDTITTVNLPALIADGGTITGNNLEISSNTQALYTQSPYSTPGGIIAANGGEIEITGASSYTYSADAINNSAVAVETGGKVLLDGINAHMSTTTTSSPAFAVVKDAGSSLTIQNSDITSTTGKMLTVTDGGKANLEESNFTISGYDNGPSHIFSAVGIDSEITGKNLVVTNDRTDGGNGTFFARTDGKILLEDSEITSTEGQVLLWANNRGVVEGKNLDLEFTKGSAYLGYAIRLDSNGQMLLTDSELEVNGAASGFIVSSGATLTLDHTTAKVNASGQGGVTLNSSGVSLIMNNNSSITSDGLGIYAFNGGTFDAGTSQTVSIDNSQIVSSGSYAMQLEKGELQLDVSGEDALMKGKSGGLRAIGVTDNTHLVAEFSQGAQLEGQVVSDYSSKQAKVDLAVNTGAQWIGDAKTSGTSTIDITLSDDGYWEGGVIGYGVSADISESTWKLTKDSIIDSLHLTDQGIVSFGTDLSGGEYGMLAIEELTGSGGLFKMRTDIAAGQGDLLFVASPLSGVHDVAVVNNGSAAVTGNETLTIVQTVDDDAVNYFNLQAPVELGGYEYGLRATALDAADLELYSTGKITSAGSASVNIASGSYLLNYAETQTLLQRMGDLRQGESDGNIWARAFGGKFASNSDDFLSGFDMSYGGIQVGVDKKIALKNSKGDVYLGGMLGYAKGNLDYGVGNGSIDSKTLGVYGTYVAPTGLYADLVLKYGWMENDFKVLDSAGDWVTGNRMKTDGLSGSLEVGQRVHFDRKSKEGWYVEPQAQISMGHQSGGSFNASNGLQVDVDSYNSTLGRLGLNAGYEIKSGKNPINIYAKASYVHEFDGDVGYRLNGSSEQTSFGDSWWTYGVGITAQFEKKHNIYLDIERASGGQFSQPWSVNGGYRFNW